MSLNYYRTVTIRFSNTIEVWKNFTRLKIELRTSDLNTLLNSHREILLFTHSTIMAIDFNCATKICLFFLPLAAVTFVFPTLVPLPPPFSHPLPFSLSGYRFRFMSRCPWLWKKEPFWCYCCIEFVLNSTLFLPHRKNYFFSNFVLGRKFWWVQTNKNKFTGLFLFCYFFS